MHDSFLYRYAHEYSEARIREAANERRARQVRREAALAGEWGGLSVLGPLRRMLEGLAGWLAAPLGMRAGREDGPRHVAQGA